MNWPRIDRRALFQGLSMAAAALAPATAAKAQRRLSFETPFWQEIERVRAQPRKIVPELTRQVLGSRVPCFKYTRIRVTDPERSDRFYTEGVGMKRLRFVASPGTRAVELVYGFADKPGLGQLLLMYDGRTSPLAPTPAQGQMVFIIPDAVAAYERCLKLGGQPQVYPEPEGIYGEVLFTGFLLDPDGHSVELMQVKGAPVTGP